ADETRCLRPNDDATPANRLGAEVGEEPGGDGGLDVLPQCRGAGPPVRRALRRVPPHCGASARSPALATPRLAPAATVVAATEDQRDIVPAIGGRRDDGEGGREGRTGGGSPGRGP